MNRRHDDLMFFDDDDDDGGGGGDDGVIFEGLDAVRAEVTELMEEDHWPEYDVTPAVGGARYVSKSHGTRLPRDVMLT